MHTDDMNDLVLMGLARDAAEREVKELREQLAVARSLLDDLMFHDFSGKVAEFLGYDAPYEAPTSSVNR